MVMNTSGLIKAALKLALPFYMDDERLTIICKDSVQKNTLSEEGNVAKIKEVLENIHQKKFELNVIAEKEYSASNEGDYEDIERAISNIRTKINFDVEIQ